MSDLERFVVDGSIVNPNDQSTAPYSSPDEARTVMTQAFMLMREGDERFRAGNALLEIAERRLAWQVLGYGSWEECVTEGLSEHLRISIDSAQRMQMVLAQRAKGQQITPALLADSLGVHRTTVTRDIAKLREAGMLDEEPERVLAADGRMRPTRLTPAQEQAAPRRPRSDLAKAWIGVVDVLARKADSLSRMREDDRYAARLADLARTRGDLLRARNAIDAALEDFKITDGDAR